MIKHSYDLVVKGMTKKDQAMVKDFRRKNENSQSDWHS